MTQDQVFLLLLKIALPMAVVTLLVWVFTYAYLTRTREHGRFPWVHATMWRDPIGQSLVIETLIVIVQLTLLSLAVFVHLNRLDNRAVGWLYAVFTLAITPVMIWRTVVWVRASRKEGPEE